MDREFFLVGFSRQELNYVISAIMFELDEYYEPDADWWKFENDILKKLKGKL